MSKRNFKGDINVGNNADVQGELGLPAESTERALELDSSGKVKSSAVTSTELGHLSGVTSNIQTQLDAKADEVDVVLRDGSQDFTGEQSMGGNKLTNLAAPTADNDAARKADVDAARAGVKVKDPAQLVSTANITLSGEQTIDGVLTASSRVAVTGQTNTVENGIYVTAAGAWTRATDFDGTPSNEVSTGVIVFIEEGTDNANTQYILRDTDAADPALINVGTDTQEWTIYSRAEAITAGDGLDKNGLELSVDVTEIQGSGLEDDGSNNLRISSSAIDATLTGGSGTAIGIDFDTTGQKAVSADNLNSNSNGLGASLIGIEDSAGDYTATDVEGALAEVKTDLDGKQNDVITTQGDIVVGNASGEESRLALGANGQVLQSNGTDLVYATIAVADEQVKVSANDSTSKFLEDALTSADSSITITTLNDGSDEDLDLAVNEANVDHDALQNFEANEHIDHSTVEIATAASTSGLTGGGDLTATRNLAVDITGTTAETVIDDTDELLIHDQSAGAIRKMSRANLLAGLASASPGDIAETSFSGANNQAAPANVTGLSFSNAQVRSAHVHISILVDATTDLYETYDLQLIQRSADWVLTQESTGDDSQVVFTVDTAGQIQYTSANYAGFSSLTIKFRAITTSV